MPRAADTCGPFDFPMSLPRAQGYRCRSFYTNRRNLWTSCARGLTRFQLNGKIVSGSQRRNPLRWEPPCRAGAFWQSRSGCAVRRLSELSLAIETNTGETTMKICKLFGVAGLFAGLVAIALGSLTAPASAQSLEDALRRSQEGPRGGGGAPPPRPPAPPPSFGGSGSSAGSNFTSTLRWGALAAAMWRRNGVVQVAVGSAIKYRTKAEAESAALRQCRGAGGSGCKVASTWSNGCGYITTGRNSGGAGWVARATYNQTMRDCRARGYNCKPAIGGCL
jgi:hypothetical protein